ncbi:MAG: O-antigen ligase family protein [Sedimentisphaerales bacterium]
MVNTQYTILNTQYEKSKGQVILEYILLALCLCVIALRTTYTESPAAQSATSANLSDNLYTLSVSAVLFFSFVLWFICGLCSPRFLYRFTAIEIGLCLFCIAAIIAGLAASNKRAAITDAVCLIAPVLMAVLLVQILDSQSKIKLVLVVIAALGVVSSYQCAEQFFVSNQATIAQYEQAPQTILEPFGIQSGSIQQFLFEHLLYSRDVRGFFTTGNSAGSFAILASFAAVALFIDKFKNRQSLTSLIKCGVAVAVIVFGLIITRSKGAIAASLIAAFFFVAFLYFGDWLKLHKKAILLVCLLFLITVGCAIAAYGSAHDRLPGGNSMLVRWQYWYVSAKMYADHRLTGVGPGNFAHFYTHYKPAAAAESVSDPHNFLLSILTQYGPLGLVGFLAMLFIPLWRTIPSSLVRQSASEGGSIEKKQADHQPSFRTLAITYLTIVSVALLFIRPMIMLVTIGDTFEVMLYLIFTLYVAPVIAYAVGFWLLTADTKTRVTGHGARGTYIPVALFCAVLGLLLHNLIDFAIFEPPVFTAFCAIVACLIALDFQQNSRPGFVLKPALFARIILAAAGLILIGGYLNYALVPVAKTSAYIQRATQQGRQFEYAHQLLDQATEQDRLDPTAPNLNGRLYLQHYNETPNAQPALLKKAEACFLAAIARDNADFKNYEKLSEVYTLLAKTATVQRKNDWLNYAIDTLWSAVERYPGSSQLRIELAEVAEQLDKADIAIAQYEKAIEIEDAYCNQFKIMYPGREIFSRLGEEKYNNAKQRIKFLSERLSP